jgi:hypothetical protein
MPRQQPLPRGAHAPTRSFVVNHTACASRPPPPRSDSLRGRSSLGHRRGQLLGRNGQASRPVHGLLSGNNHGHRCGDSSCRRALRRSSRGGRERRKVQAGRALISLGVYGPGGEPLPNARDSGAPLRSSASRLFATPRSLATQVPQARRPSGPLQTAAASIRASARRRRRRTGHRGQSSPVNSVRA